MRGEEELMRRGLKQLGIRIRRSGRESGRRRISGIGGLLVFALLFAALGAGATPTDGAHRHDGRPGGPGAGILLGGPGGLHGSFVTRFDVGPGSGKVFGQQVAAFVRQDSKHSDSEHGSYPSPDWSHEKDGSHSKDWEDDDGHWDFSKDWFRDDDRDEHDGDRHHDKHKDWDDWNHDDHRGDDDWRHHRKHDCGPVVPEPSTAGLMGLGLAMLAWRRRGPRA